jgi:hypothetical protein
MTPALQKLAVEARKRNASKRRALKEQNFIAPKVKTCNKCGNEKSIELFPKNRGMADGYLNSCKECAYARTAEWKDAHPCAPKPPRTTPRMSAAEIRRRSYQKHKAKRLAARKAFRLANIEREKARERRYLQNNRSIVRAKNGRRRAAETRAVPPWLNAIQKAQIQEFYEIAAARTTQTGIKHHVDHEVPLRGVGVHGLHVPWNLQILTEFENCSKHNKIVERRV